MFYILLMQDIKRCNGDFLNIEILESSTQGPFRLELKVQVQQPRTTDITSKSDININKDEEQQRMRNNPYIMKLSNSIKNRKYKRSHYYQLDEEDVRLFIFDKNEYSVDDFGQCLGNNRPSGDFQNSFFGQLVEGLMFDSESNSFSVDFLEKLKIMKYYHDAISATEKVLISRVYDDRKIENAMRESVAKMAELERVSLRDLLL
jgi:hypothetical protein